MGISMPKVTKEYMEQKRKFIVDATYRVCLRKPVSMVTMMDIIHETGLSQGGIYRFFSDLDEILREMILQLRQNFGIMDETDLYFEMAEQLTTAQMIEKICDMLADRMEKSLMDVQKINFDLSVMAINEPERVRKILDGIKEEGNMEHLTRKTKELLEQQIAAGKCKPRVPIEDLMKFVSCAYNGIERNCILSNCYSYGPMQEIYSPRALFQILAKTYIYLLGEEGD